MGVNGALLMPEVAGEAEASGGVAVCTEDNDCVHSAIDAAGPPTIVTVCNSVSLPRTVPWYRDSSPVLLCFFFRAVHQLVTFPSLYIQTHEPVK